ncbi:aminotransferase class III-fold pyridoxal phosphate-dependent enzyme [Nocardia sp. NPDC050175]|uniref:aminotransferase class III-fold pyridoxal phosphate-dependent enzyme n=1 Tax=Nocardia sp. NPDC050175 TaxID=3364317 RepID=UPI0037A6579A
MTTRMTGASAFTPATAATLETIRKFNEDGKCTFLISSNYMHADSAKLGYLLSSLLTGKGDAVGDHRTYFVNSSLEALSGAIKLARQTSVRAGKADGGWVLLVDEEAKYAPYLDPTSRGEEDGLTPHVRFVRSIAEAQQVVAERNWSALVHVRYPGARDDAAQLVGAARRRGAMVIACDAELELADAELLIPGYSPDVVVFGENLAEHQVPFGCFVMTEQAYSVWNNDVDCFAQTSTFGGNRLCAVVALDALDRHGFVSAEHRVVFDRIDAGHGAMIAEWGRYVNPAMARLGGVFGMDLDVRSAVGGRLRLGDGREILDCSGGFGSSLRGHNPADMADVLTRHDPDHDYVTDLESLLASLTKFPHAFPAVSGGTAVDIAAALGMLSKPGRRKIVTFKGNFSGKTLFALNFSKHGPQLTESDADAFRPYYSELVYVDPFAEGAASELTRILGGGDVALVWFELIHGGMCQMLPDEIIAVINEKKSSGGYVIGVDEVLTGGWRTGGSYLAHDKVIPESDIVAIGKTLSDMTMPMAATLVTAEVYQRACETDATHVGRLAMRYRNNLSAAIALNALSSVRGENELAAVVRNQRVIDAGLREIISGSKIFSDLRGGGALLLPVMNHKYFPFGHRSKPGNLLEMATSHLIFERCGVFVFLLRFLQPVVTTDADAQEIVDRLRRGIDGITPTMVYRYALSRILAEKLPRMSALLEGQARTVANRPAVT